MFKFFSKFLQRLDITTSRSNAAHNSVVRPFCLRLERLEARCLLTTFTLDWDVPGEPAFTAGQNLASVNSLLDSANIPIVLGSYNQPTWTVSGSVNRFLTGSSSALGADFFGNFTDSTRATRVAMEVGFFTSPTTATLTAYAEPIVDASSSGLAGMTVVGTQQITVTGAPSDQFFNFDFLLSAPAKSFSLEVNSATTTIFATDFQSDTPGTVPSAVDRNQQNGTTTAVTTTNAAADPFGVPGNQSMKLVDRNNSSTGYRAVIPIESLPSASSDLIIEMDMVYTAPVSNWTITNILVGDSVGATLPWYPSAHALQLFPAINTSGIASVGQLGGYYSQSADGGGGPVIIQNEPFHLKIVTNSTTSVYNVFIDGVQLGWDFGNGTIFDMPTVSTDLINMITFTSEGLGLQSMGDVYIDNLQVSNTTTPTAFPITINSLEWDSLQLPPLPVESTAIGEWHEFRGNGQHTGLAELTGNIVNREILWSQYLGSRETWTALKLDGSGPGSIVLPTTDIGISQSELISFDIGGEWYDLDSSGVISSYGTSGSTKIGDFLPDSPGLELLQVNLISGSATSDGTVTLSKRVSGNWVEVWESVVLPLLPGPNIIAGDFDDDGQLEVALTPWDNLYVLNMASGVVERTATFKPPGAESGRPYGFHGAYDINNDGRSEFVIMGDFQEFITVMGWNASGQLVKLWDHLIEAPITAKSTVHRPGIQPVMDITGDGNSEILTSIFNDNGDGKWHVVAYNGLTGAIVLDLPDYFLDGMRDVDSDGAAELFVTKTSGSSIPTTGPVEIRKYIGSGNTTSLWQQSGVSFQSQPLSKIPETVNTTAATGRLALLAGPIQAGGEEVFFTKRVIDASTGTMEVVAWKSNGHGSISQIASVIGPDAEALAVRIPAGGAAEILLQSEVFTEDQYGTLISTSVSETFVYSAQKGPPRSSAVIGKLGGSEDRPTVVIQGGGELLTALQPDLYGNVDMVWRTPGRGISSGGDSQTGEHGFAGVALADIFGDGRLATISATKNEGGQARLTATAADGTRIWQSDFPVSGASPIFNQGALTFWQAGRFNAAHRDDILVTVRRGSLHSDVFYMLDGRTGEVLWTRDWGNTPGFGSPRGAGGSQLVVHDWDEDGLEEAINFFPDKFYVVDGNGANLIDKDFTNSIFGPVWPFYGNPILADFLNNGTQTLLYAGGYQILGLLDLQGNAIWQKPFQSQGYPGFLQGVGDVDGDGDLDLLSPGHQRVEGNTALSEFRAYDAASGNLLWTLPLPGAPFGAIGFPYSNSPTLSVTADIDGDGRVESIFAIGGTLYVVGATPDGTAGQIKWGMSLGGLLGSPIVADANGDGELEIVVVSDNGYIYGIGQQPSLPGDFDNDRDVDGRDFLIWQRNSGVGNLADWQSNYGNSLAPLRSLASVTVSAENIFDSAPTETTVISLASEQSFVQPDYFVSTQFSTVTSREQQSKLEIPYSFPSITWLLSVSSLRSVESFLGGESGSWLSVDHSDIFTQQEHQEFSNEASYKSFSEIRQPITSTVFEKYFDTLGRPSGYSLKNTCFHQGFLHRNSLQELLQDAALVSVLASPIAQVSGRSEHE